MSPKLVQWWTKPDSWPEYIVKPSILILSGGLTPKYIWNFLKLIVKNSFLKLKKCKEKNQFKLNNFCSIGSKIVKWQMCTLFHGGIFGCTKSEAGYLRVWEGHGWQWFLLGELLHCGNKRKKQITCKCYNGCFRICLQILPYFQG